MKCAWLADVRHIKGNPKAHVGYAPVLASGMLQVHINECTCVFVKCRLFLDNFRY